MNSNSNVNSQESAYLKHGTVMVLQTVMIDPTSQPVAEKLTAPRITTCAKMDNASLK